MEIPISSDDAMFLAIFQFEIQRHNFEVELIKGIISGSINLYLILFYQPNLFTLEQRECLKRIEEENHQVLLLAAKHGNAIIVKFLIECGVNVNVLGEDNLSAIDIAFLYEYYEIMLILLQADSNFPSEYLKNGFKLDNDNTKKISRLVDERIELHQFIQNKNLDAVRKLLPRNTNYGLECLNLQNQSALYVALDFKSYNCYAFLKYRGLQFKDEEEKKIICELGKKEKNKLRRSMLPYFKPVKNAYIYYLISKSRSEQDIENFPEKLKYFYEKLNSHDEIKVILQLVQHSKYLDIIFDFDKYTVESVCPEDSKPGENVLGLADLSEGRIYVGAASAQNENGRLVPEDDLVMLGTLAHELTHLAMQILYSNNGNPYGSPCGNHNYDTEMTKRKHEMNDFIDIAIKNWSFLPTQIAFLLESTSYTSTEHHREVIARILEAIVNEKDISQRNWFTGDFLSKYWNYIKKDSKQFQRNRYFTTEDNTNAILRSQTFAEIQRFQSYNALCTQVDRITSLPGKRICIYKFESTTLGLLKIFQGTLGTPYLSSKDDFLVFTLDYFLILPDDIIKKLHSQPKTTIIFKVPYNPNKDIEKISKFVSSIRNKVIFLVRKDFAPLLKNGLRKEGLSHEIEEGPDDKSTLFDLDEESQKIILERNIIFQGREIMLKELIAENDEIYKEITPTIIEKLLNGGKFTVGGKLYGTSNQEGAYADILLPVNFDSLENALEKPKTIFIIEDKHTEKCGKEEMIRYFKNYIDGEKICSDHFNQLKNTKFQIVLSEGFSDKSFQKLCDENPERMIYKLKINDLQENSFILQKLYDPSFYVTRKIRRVTKVILDADKMYAMIAQCQDKSESFIISGKESSQDSKHENIILSNKENAETKFSELIKIKSKKQVHLLQKEDDKLIWIKSYQSITNLRPCIIYDLTEAKLVEEMELITDIVDQKVLILADNPGMGKSTTLTRLYAEESIAAKNWIIRINLRYHSGIIAKKIDLHKIITIETVICCLREIELDQGKPLDEIILKSLLYKTGKLAKSLLIAFDGFDEISNEKCRDKIIQFLKFLKYETPCKFWITTRLHHKELLENELCSFAIELEPFDDAVKNYFIKKYFKERLNLILDQKIYNETFSNGKDSKIWVYTNELLKRMGEVFQGDISKFIGTPLQLNLVLSDSVTHFKTWVENIKHPTPDFLYLGENLLDMYRRFIDRKYKIYFAKINLFDEDCQKPIKTEIDGYHEQLAKSLVFKSQGLELNHTPTLLSGIVQKKDQKNVEFIHFTFREYYCAKLCITYLKKISKNKLDSYDKELEDFFFDEILQKPEYELIRKFIDDGLSETDFLENWYVATQLHNKGVIFHTLASEGCQHIFSSLFHSYIRNVKTFFIFKGISIFHATASKNLLFSRDRDNNPLFYSIIKGKDHQMLTILTEELKSLPTGVQKNIILNRYKKWHGSILHLTLMFSNFELFKLLNERIRHFLRPDIQRALLLMTNCVKETILHRVCIADNHTAVMYILSDAKERLPTSEFKRLLLMKTDGKEALNLLRTPLSQSEIKELAEKKVLSSTWFRRYFGVEDVV